MSVHDQKQKCRKTNEASMVNNGKFKGQGKTKNVDQVHTKCQEELRLSILIFIPGISCSEEQIALFIQSLDRQTSQGKSSTDAG